jgi:hypothetical protein
MKSKRVINVIALVVGIGALAFLIYKVGWRELVDNLLAVGPAFPLFLAIEAFSNVFSCFGWYYAFDPSDRPRYFKLLSISFASLSLAGALPTGQAGEVAKANLVRGHAGATEILSSLLIYNYFHILTTVLVVLTGPIVVYVTGGFSELVILVTMAICVAVFAVTALLGVLLYWGILHKLLEWVGGLHWSPWKPSDKLMAGVREVDVKLRQIISTRPGDLLKGVLGLLVGRLFQVAEIYAILAYMGVSDSVGVSLMIFSTTAMVNYLLMVLPAREGFLEGSTWVVFKLLGMSGADGLSLEITRRLRKVFYQLIGIVLMAVFVGRKDRRSKP